MSDARSLPRPPTARQVEALRFIAAHAAKHGFPPSIREVTDGLGLASTNGGSDHLRALKHKGLITVAPKISRGMVLTEKGRACLAQVTAERTADREPAPETSSTVEGGRSGPQENQGEP
jgi:repressor LexA